MGIFYSCSKDIQHNKMNKINNINCILYFPFNINDLNNDLDNDDIFNYWCIIMYNYSSFYPKTSKNELVDFILGFIKYAVLSDLNYLFNINPVIKINKSYNEQITAEFTLSTNISINEIKSKLHTIPLEKIYYGKNDKLIIKYLDYRNSFSVEYV